MQTPAGRSTSTCGTAGNPLAEHLLAALLSVRRGGDQGLLEQRRKRLDIFEIDLDGLLFAIPRSEPKFDELTRIIDMHGVKERD
jgi:hypothetical protein